MRVPSLLVPTSKLFGSTRLSEDSGKFRAYTAFIGAVEKMFLCCCVKLVVPFHDTCIELLLLTVWPLGITSPLSGSTEFEVLAKFVCGEITPLDKPEFNVNFDVGCVENVLLTLGRGL